MSELPAFPTDFLWGAATASFQIEGAANEGGRGPSIWDTFCRVPGKVLNGDTGDVACDHAHRMAEDVGLLAELGFNAYRFSMAWPRFQAEGTGALNQAGIDFYSRLLDELDQHSILPWPTLYHWDLPQALEDAGGWRSRDTALRFADYAASVHEVFADRISNWTTLNEPWCSAFLGYAAGVHAPGIQDPAGALAAAHHLMLGHGLAVQRMRESSVSSPEHSYGITLNLHPTYPATPTPADEDAARRVDAVANRIFLDPLFRGSYPADLKADVSPISAFEFVADGDLEVISTPLDFLGLNYYYYEAVGVQEPQLNEPSPWVGSEDVRQVKTGRPQTDMGWEIESDGLRVMLRRLSDDYGIQRLYVTENGMANADVRSPEGQVHDPERISYLEEHLAAAQQAIAEGVGLKGYFAWSLLDNFEWSFGYNKRFGLVYVDYETLERTPKDSALWFAEFLRNEGLG